jgi:hypothetical protein
LNGGAALSAGLEASGVNDLFRGGQALSEGKVASGLFLIGTSLPGGGKAGKVLGGFGDIAGGVAKVDEALAGAVKWLGDGYKEIAPGVFRSADDARQFRMTTSDLMDKRKGTHVHFESIGPDGREIVENSHVRIE